MTANESAPAANRHCHCVQHVTFEFWTIHEDVRKLVYKNVENPCLLLSDASFCGSTCSALLPFMFLLSFFPSPLLRVPQSPHRCPPPLPASSTCYRGKGKWWHHTHYAIQSTRQAELLFIAVTQRQRVIQACSSALCMCMSPQCRVHMFISPFACLCLIRLDGGWEAGRIMLQPKCGLLLKWCECICKHTEKKQIFNRGYICFPWGSLSQSSIMVQAIRCKVM